MNTMLLLSIIEYQPSAQRVARRLPGIGNAQQMGG